jgi:hypothetical protein
VTVGKQNIVSTNINLYAVNTMFWEILNNKLNLKPHTPWVNVVFFKSMVNVTVSLFLAIYTDILPTASII